MVATIAWYLRDSTTGGAFGAPSGGALQFRAADSNASGTANPLVRPSAGNTNYSFEKALRIYVTGGTFTQLSNLRFQLSRFEIFQISGSPTAQAIRCFYGFTATYADPIGTVSSVATTQITATTAISWTGASNHTSGTGVTWNGSQILYLQLRLNGDFITTGGDLDTWNTIAVYDEI